MENIKAKIKQTNVLDLEKEILTNAAIFMIGAFCFTLLLFLVTAGWYLSAKNSLAATKEKIADLDRKLLSLKGVEEEYLAFAGAVNNIKVALNACF